MWLVLQCPCVKVLIVIKASLKMFSLSVLVIFFWLKAMVYVHVRSIWSRSKHAQIHTLDYREVAWQVEVNLPWRSFHLPHELIQFSLLINTISCVSATWDFILLLIVLWKAFDPIALIPTTHLHVRHVVIINQLRRTN